MKKLELENHEELQKEMDRIEAFLKMKDAKWRERFEDKTLTIYVEIDTTIRNWTFAVPLTVDVGFGRSAGYVPRDLGPADKKTARLMYEIEQVRAAGENAPGVRPIMLREFYLGGHTITIKHFDNGRIVGSSHWKLIADMVKAGMVREANVDRGSCGDREIFFVLDGIGIPKS